MWPRPLWPSLSTHELDAGRDLVGWWVSPWRDGREGIAAYMYNEINLQVQGFRETADTLDRPPACSVLGSLISTVHLCVPIKLTEEETRLFSHTFVWFEIQPATFEHCWQWCTFHFLFLKTTGEIGATKCHIGMFVAGRDVKGIFQQPEMPVNVSFSLELCTYHLHITGYIFTY